VDGDAADVGAPELDVPDVCQGSLPQRGARRLHPGQRRRFDADSGLGTVELWKDTVNLDNGDHAELLVHFDGSRAGRCSTAITWNTRTCR
jgi:hypothetical protein